MRRYEIPENQELCLNFLSGGNCTCHDPSNMNKKEDTNESINDTILYDETIVADEIAKRIQKHRDYILPYPEVSITPKDDNPTKRKSDHPKLNALAIAQLKAQAEDQSNPKLQAKAKELLKVEEDRKAEMKLNRKYLANIKVIVKIQREAQKRAQEQANLLAQKRVQFKSEQAKRQYELDRDNLLDSILKPKISDSIKDQN